MRAASRAARFARQGVLAAGIVRGHQLMTTTAHLERLNAAQRKAVTHGEVLAEKGVQCRPAADRGRRRAPARPTPSRIASRTWSINGVDPARILMLTFTRRAAARDAPPRARHHAQGARRARSGGQGQAMLAAPGLGGHLPLDRQPAAAPLRAAPASSIRSFTRDRPRRCGRPDGQPAPGTGLGRARSSASRARTPASRSTPIASTRRRACSGDPRAAVSRGARSGKQDLAKLFRAYVERKQRCGAARLRRPAALLARA